MRLLQIFEGKRFAIDGYELVDSSNPKFPDDPYWVLFTKGGENVGHISMHTYPTGKSIAGITVKDRGKGLGQKIVQALAKHYGSLSSDPQGVTSEAAKKMWERIPGVEKVSTNKNTKGYFYRLNHG